jgi:hypothetical protein
LFTPLHLHGALIGCLGCQNRRQRLHLLDLCQIDAKLFGRLLNLGKTLSFLEDKLCNHSKSHITEIHRKRYARRFVKNRIGLQRTRYSTMQGTTQ